MKTICGERGDTLIRSPDRLADRAAIIVGACAWFMVGEEIVSKRSDIAAALASGHAAPISWLFFTLWLIVLTFICARIAWSFFGATKISVSSDELVARHYIGTLPIFSSRPIKLSTISDVVIDEQEVYFKGTRRHRWILIVHLDGGGTRRVAKFTNGRDANEFMNRYVR